MKLDRNINRSGKGKYALINLRKLPGDPRTAQELSMAIVHNPETVESSVFIYVVPTTLLITFRYYLYFNKRNINSTF